MRINLDNHRAPGVQTESTLKMGNEISRFAVFLRQDEYVGEIVYVSRRTKAGTAYGWRPAKAAAQSALHTKTDAALRLPRLSI